MMAGQDSLVSLADQDHPVTLAGLAAVDYQELMDYQVIQVHLEETAGQDHQVCNNMIISYHQCMHILVYSVDVLGNLSQIKLQI